MRPRGSTARSAARFLEQRAKRREPLPVARHVSMSITVEQIEQLRVGAVRDRDRLFIGVCVRALRGELDAINACRAALYGLA